MIKWIEIKNFKSIQNDKVFLPEVGAVVGNNSAGKTNLLQAIGYLKRLALGDNTRTALKGYVISPDELFNVNLASKESTLGIGVQADDGQEYLFEISYQLHIDSRPLITIKQEILYVISDEKKTLVYDRKQNNIQDFQDKVIPLSVDADKLALYIYKNPHAQAVKAIFQKIHFPEIEFKSLRESLTSPTDETLARFLMQLKTDQEESYKIFTTIVRKLLPSFSDIVEVAPKTLSKTSEDRKIYLVLLEEKTLNSALSMETVSIGDLRTLFILSITLLVKNDSTIFFEEIENALHPKRVKDLIEYLENIAKKKNIQLIYTTHSPTVINRLRPADILYAKKDSSRGTKYVSLDHPKNVVNVEAVLNSGGEITELINA